MNIIFNQAIKNIRVFPKSINWDLGVNVVKNYKRVIGYKYFIFPVYERVEEAVIRRGKYYSTLEEFNLNSKRNYIEGGIVYFKPHCTIWFGHKTYEDVFFNTVDELNSYVEEIKKTGPHIIIE